MVKFGKMYYDNSDHSLYVYIESSTSFGTINIYTLEDYLNSKEPIVEHSFNINTKFEGNINLPKDLDYSKKLLVVEVNNEKDIVIPVKAIYDKSLCYLKNLNNYCELPKEFINYILITEYIYRCKEVDYHRLLKYWNILMSEGIKLDDCRCNG